MQTHVQDCIGVQSLRECTKIIFKKQFEIETQAGDVAQLLEACLACTRPWGPVPALQKLTMVA